MILLEVTSDLPDEYYANDGARRLGVLRCDGSPSVIRTLKGAKTEILFSLWWKMLVLASLRKRAGRSVAGGRAAARLEAQIAPRAYAVVVAAEARGWHVARVALRSAA